MGAPQVKYVLATELSDREERVKLVATLAAPSRRMCDVANDLKAKALLLDLGEKKVESSRRIKGASSSTHSAPYDSSGGRSSKTVGYEGPKDPAKRCRCYLRPYHLSRFGTQTYGHEDDSPHYFVGNSSLGGGGSGSGANCAD
jgi:hypothetical protein